ncbi:MAG: radical SAM protein [Clostridiales bacterium]|nr:radical SAM protein [Clostridiales bacterium]
MKHANIALFIPHIGCPHRCSFCDQRSISGRQAAPGPGEVTAACSQAVEQLGEAARQAEVAFFGGSFTAIPRDQMCSLLEAAAPFVRSGQLGGIRLSTRPDAIDEEILALLRKYGVTSIELGAQSMDDRVLRQNRRGHTAEQVRSAARLIRRWGFGLGLQMMTGLPGDTPEGAWYTARELAALHPWEVRIYPAVVLRHTPMGELFLAGDYHPPGVEESVPLCAGLLRFFEGQGIRVIRLGLHASRSLEEELLGGCYHPAFRELCESRLLLEAAEEQIAAFGFSPGRLTLRVHPRDRSRMAGQHRANLADLSRRGYECVIIEDSSLVPGTVRVSEAG